MSVDMIQMDINQCDDDYYIPNAFKGTHKCDRTTSYVSCSSIENDRLYLSQNVNNKQKLKFVHFLLFQCVPILGRLFTTGGYKCECLQGYEYPFEDLITYYDGQLVEAEFENIVNDEKTRFDLYKCRLAGASALQATLALIIISALLHYGFSKWSTYRRS